MSDAASLSPTRTPRWRYLVPNAVTLSGFVLGLVAIMDAFAGEFESAAWLIILCACIDKLDGMAARLLKATSKIGMQLDSFSDLISFGCAPAALVYSIAYGPHTAQDPTFALWHTPAMSVLVQAMVIVYVLCATLRLAKFNVLEEDPTLEKRGSGPGVFYGIPTTFAGGVVAATVLIGIQYGAGGMLAYSPVLALVLGALMVSNLVLPKVGKYDNKLLNLWQLSAGSFAYVCGIFRIFPEFVMGLLALYLVTGLAWGLMHRSELMPKASRLDPYPP